MDKRLLNILRCPVTHKGLAVARRETLSKLNAAIDEGGVSNRDGTRLSTPLDEALITDDQKLAYPIENGIPVLLEGAGINLEQLP